MIGGSAFAKASPVAEALGDRSADCCSILINNEQQKTPTRGVYGQNYSFMIKKRL